MDRPSRALEASFDDIAGFSAVNRIVHDIRHDLLQPHSVAQHDNRFARDRFDSVTPCWPARTRNMLAASATIERREAELYLFGVPCDAVGWGAYSMPELRHILCPVDLSEIASHALDHAFAIAEWYEASLTILHVYSVPQPATPPSPGMIEDLPEFRPPQPGEVADEVRRFSSLPNRLAGARANVVVVEGSPVKQILRQADQLPADLLVMGTHGRGGFEALFLGSVTEKVLRSTHVPVLTVPPLVARVESVAYKTILCPIEFSDPSTRALEFALTLAEETGARLILLHVVEMLVDMQLSGEVGYFDVPEYQRRLEKDARARLRAAIPEDARAWCTPVELVMSGKAYRAILEVADQEHAEIIVMGVHGKGALNRRLLGSTTHHVIREARCPVLTLRG